ncbi:predicted protein [Verticillium alfalfae VaMs.102]|uniref:Predicted protein n=1 Tax=Verticillium alfalfae (strain VaMs.102 / ATCC MYA-4576 / FGSC 10136) TaxID=526221 RepID=C9SS11_VERA1|nr:predicted protein [Verticillium alfalfae VaMs.102]EEY21576.1 predicted protein [Verticillium alfalfae VaMs.102]
MGGTKGQLETRPWILGPAEEPDWLCGVGRARSGGGGLALPGPGGPALAGSTCCSCRHVLSLDCDLCLLETSAWLCLPACLATVFISLLNMTRPGVLQGRCSSFHVILKPLRLPDPGRIPQQYGATRVLAEEAITGLKRRCLLGAIVRQENRRAASNWSSIAMLCATRIKFKWSLRRIRPSLSAIRTKAPS